MNPSGYVQINGTECASTGSCDWLQNGKRDPVVASTGVPSGGKYRLNAAPIIEFLLFVSIVAP